MSKNLTNKPIKGTSLFANAGVFDTLEANKIILPSETIDGLIEGSTIENITIINSEIRSTVIGVSDPSEGYFTRLEASNVKFTSIPGATAEWNTYSGIFSITGLSNNPGGFAVSGCSTLGNLGICENTIRALNSNGDIILIPRQFGSIYLNGPIRNIVSSIGNYLTSLNNGNVTFLSSDYINLTSKSSSNTFTSFSGQTINTGNGDINFNTDTDIGHKLITSILTNTTGNLIVTTSTPSSVKVGDLVTLSSTSSIPSVDGSFIVTNIFNSNLFSISTGSTFSGLTSNGTSGILYKPPSNNINLNASVHVKIPENIDLVFGSTSNNIYGNTGGLYLQSQGDFTFNLSGSNIVNIPQTTKFQLGTSGNNFINFDGNGININTYNKLNFNAIEGFINIPDVYFKDANPMIANYTQYATDLTDRGIEFKYFDGSEVTGSAKLGWFGWKKDTGKFTFIKNATNNNEVFTGTLGEFELGAVTAASITLVTGGNFININCGSLLNVSKITGCGNTLNIDASNIVNISTASRIALQSGGDIYLPHNIPITIGTSGTLIKEGTVGNLWLNGSKNIMLNTQTIGSVIIQPNVKISFDGTSVGNQRISSDSNGNLNLNTNCNINLVTTAGNIIIPQNTSGSATGFPSIQFGGTFETVTTTATETISGSTRGIFLVSNSSFGSINSIASSSVNVTSSSGNFLVNTFNGDIQLFATSGNVTTGGNVRLYQGSRVVFGISGTSNSIRSNSYGNLMINGPNSIPTSGTTGNAIELSNATVINLRAGTTVNIPTNVQTNFDNASARFIIADTLNNFNITHNSSGTINITSLNTNIINTGGTTSISNSTTNLITSTTNITAQNFTLSGSTTNSTTTINTQNVKLYDPILSLANYTTGSTDGKDRGIEYNYTNTSGSSKLGWFGYKNTTGQFTYYSDAINTNEVITGTLGQFALGSVVVENSLSFLNTGNINLNCGTISNTNTILGCNGVINVVGNTTVNLVGNANVSISSANINLISNTTGRVLIPSNVPLAFGSTNNNINTDSLGNITITSNNGSGRIILNADVQINGTTENVYSTVTNVQDPVFSLGGVTPPLFDDFKDRGIEFKWYGNRNSVTGNKVGFFGFDNSSQRFTYIPFATNANEIMTGTPGDVQFTDGYFKNLDLSCGTISNVAVISACAGQGLSLVSSSGNINISSSNIVVPTNTKLTFGTSSNTISSDTSGNFLINNTNSSRGIVFTTNTNGTGYTQFSQNSPMYFGAQSSGNFLMRNTSGNFQINNTSGDILLYPLRNQSTSDYGSVIIPTNNKLVFGDPGTRIESDTSGNLNIYGFSIGINSTSNITFNGNVDIAGSLNTIDTGTYIYQLGTKQKLTITSIVNSPTIGSIIVTTDMPHYLVVGDSVKLANTNSIPSTNGDYLVKSVIGTYSFTLENGTLSNPGNKGIMLGVLKVYQGKDVGIEVDYWSTVGNTSITAGSINYKQAFFGWVNNTQEWTYYSNATIDNSIITQGILGNLRANQLFANRVSGFILTGSVTAGSNAIVGSNFQISGGTIDGTPIGQTTAQTGRFTSLASTISTSLENVSLQSNMNYSTETYILGSLVVNRNPVASKIISYVIISGVGFIGTGDMPLTGLTNGQIKKIICTSASFDSQYQLNFASERLIAPNPLNGLPPTKITFKRQGQSCELIWNSTQINDTTGAWVLIGGTGAYIS
jgi:hypothetical protein